MNRLQKKCLLASTAMHSLLVVILVVGPAFLSAKKRPPDLPLLDVIPSRLVDAALFGGGNPKAKPPPAAAQAEAPKPEPPREQTRQPRQPQPEPPRSQPPERQKPVKPEPEVVKSETARISAEKSKPKISVSKDITTRSPKEVADQREKERQEEARRRERELTLARQRAAKQIESRLSGAVKSLKENFSAGTTIEMPGPGGEAYANYSQVVKSMYDRAWIDPEDVTDESATVQVKVVVNRDGTLKSDSIVQRSGIPALDKSVQNALDRVRQLPHFPDGAKEGERIFIINFNLKAKRLIG